jgi:G3E family GTPase
MASLRGEAPAPETEEYGISSFVYRARRPFHPGRLYRRFLKRYFLTKVTLDVAGDDDADEDDDEEGSGSGSDDEEGTGSGGDSTGGESGSEQSEEGEGEGDGREGLEGYEEKRKSCVAAIRRDLGGLVRSKGFFWVATQVGRWGTRRWLGCGEDKPASGAASRAP